ncbi:MAG: SAM hydrolase/SAM-dependent halogenase family protein [Acidimicrobiales bacterium]
MPRYDTISFLSDYGHADEFVGVVKSVIRSIAPHASVIDIAHDIPPHDVRAGGLCLARSAQYLCPGVVLAVVDPGVGTARRAVALEIGGGQSVLVGPDNGLLAPAVSLCGGADRAVVLSNADYQLGAPGPTFAGRDVFGPAAAHLCNGVELDELGEPIETSALLPGVLPVTREEQGRLLAEVLWVDRYGNAQLNVDPDELDSWGDRVRLRWGSDSRVARRADVYDELTEGEVGLVVDSYGLVSVVLSRGSAALALRLDAGAGVTLERVDDDEPNGTTSPVELRGRG